ncbi:Organic cation transporter protein [Operophtera brumata]|uniref:Organic cation transporter protein n=1 Tax=Operophtera brumata TaxID=104452 RepID=A0A0L7L0J7_OPEBR|nr:Organic cation transporter protein [Operophtera brumata]
MSVAAHEGATLGLFFAGKLAITFAFNSIYVLTAELFPTSSAYVQAFLYGGCSLSAALSVLLIPETQRTHLPRDNTVKALIAERVKPRSYGSLVKLAGVSLQYRGFVRVQGGRMDHQHCANKYQSRGPEKEHRVVSCRCLSEAPTQVAMIEVRITFSALGRKNAVRALSVGAPSPAASIQSMYNLKDT